MVAAITSFSGRWFFLSNFFTEPDGLTVEHRFQAAKAADPDALRRILDAATPRDAKVLGRHTPLRPDWERVKNRIMLNLVRAKFSSSVTMEGWLDSTGDAHLEEGNGWGDRYWGTVNGVGENHLGLILMRVRAELRA